MIPEPISTFIERFAKLPSIGPRLAARLAFFLASEDRGAAAGLAAALEGLAKLERCPRCFFFKPTSTAVCAICADAARNPKNIAIVEKETDLLALERAKVWRGHYLILGELAERGVLGASEKLRLEALAARITGELGGMADEIVIALAPTAFGDFTASLIAERFKTMAKKISRIGRGIPTGGELEFADPETLEGAFGGRK